MKCFKCDARIAADSRYCSLCGVMVRSPRRHSRPLFAERAITQGTRGRKPITRITQYARLQADQNNTATLEADRLSFSDPGYVPWARRVPFATGAPTRQGLNLHQAMEEVIPLATRWELTAYAGQVHLCGDPGEHKYAIFMPFGRQIQKKKLPDVMRQALTGTNGDKLLTASWILTPVLWGDIGGAKQMYAR